MQKVLFVVERAVCSEDRQQVREGRMKRGGGGRQRNLQENVLC